MFDAGTGSPVDRRTVDRSVVSFRATAAVPRVRVRFPEGRSIFRFPFGGSSATLAEPSTVVEPAAAESVVLVQAHDAWKLSK